MLILLSTHYYYLCFWCDITVLQTDVLGFQRRCVTIIDMSMKIDGKLVCCVES